MELLWRESLRHEQFQMRDASGDPYKIHDILKTINIEFGVEIIIEIITEISYIDPEFALIWVWTFSEKHG